jgi:hypothetical protein
MIYIRWEFVGQEVAMSDSTSGDIYGPHEAANAAGRLPFPWLRLLYAIGFGFIAWVMFWLIALLLAPLHYIVLAIWKTQSGAQGHDPEGRALSCRAPGFCNGRRRRKTVPAWAVSQGLNGPGRSRDPESNVIECRRAFTGPGIKKGRPH